jgi:sec-independent protein translocase protein TatA
MFGLGPMEMFIVMGIAVLLFGKRLPEVGRSLGKGIIEFKKGLNGVADDFDISGTGAGSHGSSSYGSSWRSESRPSGEPASYTESAVPKFELPGAASSSTAAASPQMEYQPDQHRD